MNANIISGSEQIGNIWRSRQRPAGRPAMANANKYTVIKVRGEQFDFKANIHHTACITYYGKNVGIFYLHDRSVS